jgi:hypothetical protein
MRNFPSTSVRAFLFCPTTSTPASMIGSPVLSSRTVPLIAEPAATAPCVGASCARAPSGKRASNPARIAIADPVRRAWKHFFMDLEPSSASKARHLAAPGANAAQCLAEDTCRRVTGS